MPAPTTKAEVEIKETKIAEINEQEIQDLIRSNENEENSQLQTETGAEEEEDDLV